jgi:hypothetical protein
MSKRDELIELNQIVVVAQAQMIDAFEAIVVATRQRRDTARLIAAYRRFAAVLHPLIERRNALMRETDERLS